MHEKMPTLVLTLFRKRHAYNKKNLNRSDHSLCSFSRHLIGKRIQFVLFCEFLFYVKYFYALENDVECDSCQEHDGSTLVQVESILFC